MIEVISITQGYSIIIIHNKHNKLNYFDDMKCNLSKYDIDNDILIAKWYDQRHDSHDINTNIYTHI